MNSTSEASNTRVNSRLGVLIDKQNLLLDRIIDEVRVSPSQNAPNKGKQILRILEEMEMGLGQSSAPWPLKPAVQPQLPADGESPGKHLYATRGFSPNTTQKYQQPEPNPLDGNSESTIGRNRKDPTRIGREKERDVLLERPVVVQAPRFERVVSGDERGERDERSYQGQGSERERVHRYERYLPRQTEIPDELGKSRLGVS